MEEVKDKMCKIAQIFVIFLVLIISTLYFVGPFGNFGESFLFNKLLMFNLSNPNIMETKYLTTSSYPGRLGNMIFRCASLYGIAKNINRQPYISQVEQFKEISHIFPSLNYTFKITQPQKNQEKIVDLKDADCKYVSPINLKMYDNYQYLALSSVYLQPFKFFEYHQNNIRKMLECNQGLRNKATIEAKQIWQMNSAAHKLCVHIRRSDFTTVPYIIESTYDFIYPSVKFIYEKLQSSGILNISLLLLGDDKEFSRNLTFPNYFTSTTVFKQGGPGYDMCFAIEHCNTYLISASYSSYAWWIGFLKKQTGDIYYNADIVKNKANCKVKYAADAYPSHWKKLKLLKNNSVTEV